jgi:hypothetical protein
LPEGSQANLLASYWNLAQAAMYVGGGGGELNGKTQQRVQA